MVLIRCREHKPKQHLTKRDYVAAVEPVGYPDTAAICGLKGQGHDTPGLAFLDRSEYELYQQGQRVFEPVNNATNIAVSDTVIASP